MVAHCHADDCVPGQILSRWNLFPAKNVMFLSIYPETAVWNNTIIPFTRNAVGSMDYTPFGLTEKVNKHLTTYSNELALTVVFEAGVVHLVDFPAVYKSLPDYVQSYVKQLPAVWDESKMIYG